MPEGHTIHRLALTLEQAFAGTHPRASSPQGRFTGGAALLDGRLVERAEAWGKHLFVTFENDVVLNVHLGLIGFFDVLRYADTGSSPLSPATERIRAFSHSPSNAADAVQEGTCPDRTGSSRVSVG